MRKLAETALVTIILLFGSGCVIRSLDAGNFKIHKRSIVTEDVILKLEGESGQTFSGTLLVDGEKRPVSGVTPANIPIRGCVIVAMLEKKDGKGSILLEIEHKGGHSWFRCSQSKRFSDRICLSLWLG
ncbi:MAG TPA: hypothetical protein EYQ50_16980 [Verrucomicrobiales bacterium]|nr:hypothetical protein [Verrucomicrobiales bacterium]